MPATDSVPIKLIFPSLLTVIDSEVGMGGFGAVFCREKDFKSKLFPRQNFYDCVSRIPGTCTHTKFILCSTTKEKPLFYYVGSHNFTASAWGKWTVKKDKFMVNNYEAGVIIDCREIPMDDLPIPYHRPARKYESDDQPWVNYTF